jgi:hypothetical protein
MTWVRLPELACRISTTAVAVTLVCQQQIIPLADAVTFASHSDAQCTLTHLVVSPVLQVVTCQQQSTVARLHQALGTK